MGRPLARQSSVVRVTPTAFAATAVTAAVIRAAHSNFLIDIRVDQNRRPARAPSSRIATMLGMELVEREEPHSGEEVEVERALDNANLPVVVLRSAHGPVGSEQSRHFAASQLRSEVCARLTEQFAVNH